MVLGKTRLTSEQPAHLMWKNEDTGECVCFLVVGSDMRWGRASYRRGMARIEDIKGHL